MMLNVTFFDFLLGIAASFIASLAFLYFILRFYIPRIEISKFIVKMADYDDPEKFTYCFKILNKSRFSAYEVQLELCQLIKIPNDGELIDLRRTKLKLIRSHIAHMPKFIPTKKIKHFAPHAVIFRCPDDLEPILTDEHKSVELQVTLRHGLTGLSRVYKWEYARPASLSKTKEFGFGNNMGLA
jgi:hypothetical protein